jgi:hypothetical protein
VSRAQLSRLGYGGLLAVAAMLPFEFTQHPFLQTPLLTITNLKLVLYIVAVLAAASLLRSGRSRASDATCRHSIRALRLPLSLLVAVLLCSLLSSALAAGPAARNNSLKWTFDILIGGLLWLVIPLWLAPARERRTALLLQTAVAAACLAAGVGILEIVLGAGHAPNLSWFKPKPTLAGSFLRLSGTFEYANIAAMYLELALPLAVAGLGIAVRHGRLRPPSVLTWLAVVVLLFEGILLTFSRGALLGVTASLVVSAVLAYRNRGRLALTGRQCRLLVAAAALSIGCGGITLTATPLALLRFTSPSDQQWYQASYTSPVPSTLLVCQRLALPVTIANESPFVWQPSGTNVYNLGYHWLYPSGKVAVFENPRTRLPAAVRPGGTVQVLARIQAPPRAGRYLLVWDMVQENVTWFSLKSAAYVGHLVLVGGAASQGQACTSQAPGTRSGKLAGPAELPRTFSQPSRTQLWLAALRMLKTHPLLGVGPDNYRLRYGAYMQPPLASWDTRILANELYLEVGADLGLLGGGLFFGFLLAVWWPMIAALWLRRGPPPTLWHLGLVAAFAAFLGHGLVDDFLDSHAITLFVWLLCGLATTTSDGLLPGGKA